MPDNDANRHPHTVPNHKWQYIDEETARIIRERYGRVVNLLREQRAALNAVAARLLATEVLESGEFTELAGSPAAAAAG